MRVSDASAYDSMRASIMRARSEATKAQDAASTGLRVQKPSDDPYAAAAARRETSRRVLAEAAVSNTDVARTLVNTTETAVSGVYEGLDSARELALEGSSSGISDENRRVLAVQVRKIRDQMVATGNTNVSGKYVFAGLRDNVPPFQPDGTFVGEESSPDVQVMPNLSLPTSVNGLAVFGEGADSVFTTLDNLANALETGDAGTVRNSLSAIDANQERVSKELTRVGGMMENVDTVRAVADRHVTRAQTETARLIEGDPFAAATDLLRARTALETAIAVAQQIPVGGLAGGR